MGLQGGFQASPSLTSLYSFPTPKLESALGENATEYVETGAKHGRYSSLSLSNMEKGIPLDSQKSVEKKSAKADNLEILHKQISAKLSSDFESTSQAQPNSSKSLVNYDFSQANASQPNQRNIGIPQSGMGSWRALKKSANAIGKVSYTILMPCALPHKKLLQKAVVC